MNITLKSCATLSDCLPVEARKTNEVVLTLGDKLTVGALILATHRRRIG